MLRLHFSHRFELEWFKTSELFQTVSDRLTNAREILKVMTANDGRLTNAREILKVNHDAGHKHFIKSFHKTC